MWARMRIMCLQPTSPAPPRAHANMRFFKAFTLGAPSLHTRRFGRLSTFTRALCACGVAGVLDGFLASVLGPPSSQLADSRGGLACSGHGRCTSSWQECGKGSTNFSATPCCSCDLGFAGDGCEQLDARLYAGLGAGCILGLLMMLMFIAWTVRSIRAWLVRSNRVGVSAAARSMYAEPLLNS